MTLTQLAIKRPSAVAMFFLAIAVLGIMLYNRLPVDLLPTMNWPMVTVVTAWPGAGPKEVETMVSRPIEDAVVSLNKLKHIRSVNREHASIVMLEFDMSADADVVLQETQRVITTVRAQLPDDAEEPQLYKADVGAMPILRLAVSSKLSEPDLFTFVDEHVRPRLEQVDGVGQVVVTGAAEREIQKHRAMNEGKKPEAVIEKIVDGRMEKFFEEIVLLEQPFVKDDSKKISAMLAETVAELGESIQISRFARFKIGESANSDAESNE